MIKKIVLNNFMSHTHTVIEPTQGLTVLVGPNNCGKSAIVEALRAVCENTTTGFMIRHREKEALVTIETDDGHTIIWRRRKAYASYCLNGVWNDRPTSDYLLHVQSLLRLPAVRSSDGNDEFHIHFGMQKSPIFLLNESKSRQASFFASSSDAEKLIEMQKLHRAKVLDDKKVHQKLLLEIAALDAKIAALSALDELSPASELLETETAKWSASSLEIERAQSTAGTLRQAYQRRQQHHTSLKALSILSPVPTLQDESNLAGTVQRAKDSTRRREQAIARREVLRRLESTPPLADTTPLRAATERLRSSTAIVRRLAAAAATLRDLLEAPTISDESTLSASIATLKRATAAGERATRQKAAAARLRPPIDLHELAGLSSVIETLRNAGGSVNDATFAAQSALKSVSAARNQIALWVAGNPKCPTCDAPMDVERLLAGGHAHA